MISHEHRAIFIHIPKASGSSIVDKLGADRIVRDHRTVRCLRPLSLRHLPYILDREDARARWDSRKQMAAAMIGLSVPPSTYGPRATPEQWEEYYKFAVVRNPWDRVYSWYRNVQRDPKKLRNLGPSDFLTFLREHEDNWALRPQTHWLYDFDRSMPLNRIVRFERLVDDMAEVLSDLGFKDLTLPHVLNGGSADYRVAYDDASAALVAERYREEIELFGYEF